MKERTLALIKNPEFISKDDLLLLEEELAKYPYMQSVRTLKLSAVNQFDTENYPQELTKTAAYTTDKKILFQFINQKKMAEQKAFIQQKIAQEKMNKSREVESPIFRPDVQEKPPISSQELGANSTIESPFPTRKEDLNFTKETILEHMDTAGAEHDISPAEISFAGFDSFLPDVKFTVPGVKPASQIKVEKKEEPLFQPPVENEILIQEDISEVVDNATEPLNSQKEAVTEQSTIVSQEYEWRPMNWMSNPLDAQIQKVKTTSSETPSKTSLATHEKKNEVASLLPPKPAEVSVEIPTSESLKNEEESPMIASPSELPPSNVPHFVNTWQNWLKIERPSTTKEEVTFLEHSIDRKANIIDKFIEDNPKISQLKEESNFVIKEKKDDISHLMTETLALLYVEQKLYSKAIKAYGILQKKHPEKKEVFQEKIKEIKIMKQNK